MSTQETISPANWAFAYARRVLGHRWRKAKGFAFPNFNILCRPKWTGKNVIVGDGPTDLLHALQYFSKAFALTFLIYVVASRFKLYEGESEWRDLVTISVKLLIVVAIVYFLTRALPDRMSLSRLLQAALYVGGTYIIFERYCRSRSRTFPSSSPARIASSTSSGPSASAAWHTARLSIGCCAGT